MKKEPAMSLPAQKTTFTLAEAAVLLSCHRETLRRAIRAGELRAARLGREFRVSRLDLEAFWAANGGGDLFEKQPEQAAETVKEAPRPAPAQKKAGFEQLTLLPTKE